MAESEASLARRELAAGRLAEARPAAVARRSAATPKCRPPEGYSPAIARPAEATALGRGQTRTWMPEGKPIRLSSPLGRDSPRRHRQPVTSQGSLEGSIRQPFGQQSRQAARHGDLPEALRGIRAKSTPPTLLRPRSLPSHWTPEGKPAEGTRRRRKPCRRGTQGHRPSRSHRFAPTVPVPRPPPCSRRERPRVAEVSRRGSKRTRSWKRPAPEHCPLEEPDRLHRPGRPEQAGYSF